MKALKIEGKTVQDAKKPMHITITREDVRAGAKKDASDCAAAQALMRQEHCQAARVHASRTYIKKGGKWTRYATPPALRSEVVAFDRGGKFEPGEYQLVPVSESQKRGMRSLRQSLAPKYQGPPKQKRKNHITTGVRQRFNVGGKII